METTIKKTKISESQQNELIAQFTAAALTGILARFDLGKDQDGFPVIPGEHDQDDGTPAAIAKGASRIGVDTCMKFMEDCGIDVIPNPSESPC